MDKPKLFLATDHAGFELKNTLRDYLTEHNSHGYEVIDYGAFDLDPNDDYPKYIARSARAVSHNPKRDRAIVFGGSGQGEAIVANKYVGVRATVYYGGEPSIIELARKHNNTNVLSVGARFVSESELIPLVQQWLVSEFPAEPRHVRRLRLIEQLEEKRFWRRFIAMVRNTNTS